MRETMFFSLMSFVILSSLAFVWWTKVNYAQDDFIGRVCEPEIKKAMNKMGPSYNYLMKGETLYVDRGDGKWLRLDYERR